VELSAARWSIAQWKQKQLWMCACGGVSIRPRSLVRSHETLHGTERCVPLGGIEPPAPGEHSGTSQTLTSRADS
jgi:hypothetical protein